VLDHRTETREGRHIARRDVEPMALLPIFHGSRHSSLSAVMTFPRDLATAKICAGWLIASARAPELLRLGNSNHDSIIALVNDAVQMAPLYEEYLANTLAGFKAGVVVCALLSLVDQDPQTASWERAIEAAEKMPWQRHPRRYFGPEIDHHFERICRSFSRCYISGALCVFAIVFPNQKHLIIFSSKIVLPSTTWK
jgi:hypothetical protein